ncbi:MAG: response regulator transcription factor [Cyanobacteriota bacterium]|jgi:DNA-binding NarL/FixJ family response regulator|nr:response regulator transcription factor [Cyanobacteriota bacterium]
MDFTPYLQTPEAGTPEEGLLSVEVPGKIALAMKGRFLLRAVCKSFSEQSRIACAVTDQDSCLTYLASAGEAAYELLICTDYLETGNGFELVRLAKEKQPKLHCVLLALGDVIPAEYVDAPWLEAVVAEADFVEDQQPLTAAVVAVMAGHSYRSPSLRTGQLPYLSCPRLTPREYQVLDLLASGMSDRDIAKQLMVSEETAHTYSKRLLQTLGVNNRLQAVLKGMRCGMVQL